MPKVSIITRTKDRPILLERAINSVLEQTFQDWEHIIVDNNDLLQKEFEELLEKYQNKYNGRLKIIKAPNPLPENYGMEELSNIGLKNATGEYFVIHDDDDSWQNDFLNTAINELENNPQLGGICTQLNYFIEEIKDNKINVLYSYPYKGVRGCSYFDIFFSRTYPAPIATVFRVDISKQLGYFNPKMLKAGDKEFILRFIKKAPIKVINKNLANYHARPYGGNAYANSTLGNNDYEDNLYWEKRVVEELFKHNFDLWCFYHLVELIRPFLEKCKIKKALQKCENKKVMLYGAGIRATELMKNYKKEFSKLNILGIFDQNKQKHGTKFCGYNIFPPEKINEYKPEKIILTVANSSMVEGFLHALVKKNNLDCEIVII